MDFEWDEPKRKANALKHQLDFRDAIGMWAGSTLDPAAVRQHGEEVRYLALGSIGADETVIAVVIYVPWPYPTDHQCAACEAK